MNYLTNGGTGALAGFSGGANGLRQQHRLRHGVDGVPPAAGRQLPRPAAHRIDDRLDHRRHLRAQLKPAVEDIAVRRLRQHHVQRHGCQLHLQRLVRAAFGTWRCGRPVSPILNGSSSSLSSCDPNSPSGHWALVPSGTRTPTSTSASTWCGTTSIRRNAASTPRRCRFGGASGRRLQHRRLRRLTRRSAPSTTSCLDRLIKAGRVAPRREGFSPSSASPRGFRPRRLPRRVYLFLSGRYCSFNLNPSSIRRRDNLGPLTRAAATAGLAVQNKVSRRVLAACGIRSCGAGSRAFVPRSPVRSPRNSARL